MKHRDSEKDKNGVMDVLTRIVVNPGICHGKPCIKGTRVPVHIILGLLASDETKENILKAYPQIMEEDISECLLYAAILASEEVVPLKIVAT